MVSGTRGGGDAADAPNIGKSKRQSVPDELLQQIEKITNVAKKTILPSSDLKGTGSVCSSPDSDIGQPPPLPTKDSFQSNSGDEEGGAPQTPPRPPYQTPPPSSKSSPTSERTYTNVIYYGVGDQDANPDILEPTISPPACHFELDELYAHETPSPTPFIRSYYRPLSFRPLSALSFESDKMIKPRPLSPHERKIHTSLHQNKELGIEQAFQSVEPEEKNAQESCLSFEKELSYQSKPVYLSALISTTNYNRYAPLVQTLFDEIFENNLQDTSSLDKETFHQLVQQTAEEIQLKMGPSWGDFTSLSVQLITPTHVFTADIGETQTWIIDKTGYHPLPMNKPFTLPDKPSIEGVEVNVNKIRAAVFITSFTEGGFRFETRISKGGSEDEPMELETRKKLDPQTREVLQMEEIRTQSCDGGASWIILESDIGDSSTPIHVVVNEVDRDLKRDFSILQMPLQTAVYLNNDDIETMQGSTQEKVRSLFSHIIPTRDIKNGVGLTLTTIHQNKESSA